ncbi:hypothetical protein B4U80_11917, partial [Leptotrombidium deliense]
EIKMCAAVTKEMMSLIVASTKSHLIYCALKLDIVNHLYKQPMDAKQLSVITKTKPDFLYRFLRSLCSLRILQENEKRIFSVTELGSTLKSDTNNSLNNYLQLMEDESIQKSLLHLDHSIRTGQPSFEHLYGTKYYEFIRKNADKGRVFDSAMQEFENIKSVTAEYDYTEFKHIIDIGGGNGHFLISILERTPNATGMVFELEAGVKNAKVEIKKRNIEKRCTTKVGNYFESIPSGGDCYIMKHILHNLEDDELVKVLSNVRKAMKKGSKLLIMEQIIFDLNGPDPKTEFDMLMLVLYGGKSRTKDEIEEICATVMLKLQRCVELKESGEIIMEFTAV